MSLQSSVGEASKTVKFLDLTAVCTYIRVLPNFRELELGFLDFLWVCIVLNYSFPEILPGPVTSYLSIKFLLVGPHKQVTLGSKAKEGLLDLSFVGLDTFDVKGKFQRLQPYPELAGLAVKLGNVGRLEPVLSCVLIQSGGIEETSIIEQVSPLPFVEGFALQ